MHLLIFILSGKNGKSLCKSCKSLGYLISTSRIYKNISFVTIFTNNICNLRYETPKEILLIFDYGSRYDDHCIIKGLAKELESQFEYLGENANNYITFSVPIKKEIDNSKTITYTLKFIDIIRFVSSPLSSLVDNLFEGLQNDKCDLLLYGIFYSVLNPFFHI